VPATVARKLGCYLITQTMSRHHELSMESYDRLFPNQDTMPRGGFGNLIALPPQLEARREGNTEFLDDSLEPLADQWAYLASISRVTPTAAARIAQEATRSGQVIGVKFAEPSDETEDEPWKTPPSGRVATEFIPESLPREVRGVIAQQLFIDKTDLPSALLNRFKRIAAFQNPEFYKKQKMRFSTALTPRVVSCAEELQQHIALPRGCRSDVEDFLRAHDVALTIEDERCTGEPLDVVFQGELTTLQQQSAATLLQHDIGVFVAPPGIGKTVLGTYIAAMRGRNTLVLVHRKPLLDQWVTQLAVFLGVDEREIGRIGGGRRKASGKLDVAMIQSLVRKGTVNDMVAGYGHVIVDECHHVPAVSFERVLSEVKARYVLGLTATPHRRDGHHPILAMQLGPARCSVDPKDQAARRPFEHRLIVRETTFSASQAELDGGIQHRYGRLSEDEDRNQLILDDVIQAVHHGRSPIVLTERRDHLEYLANRLQGFVRHLVVLRGGMTARDRKNAFGRLTEIPESEERLVLATGRYIGEGFDDARLDTLFLAMPVSWKGTLAQYTGRLHRLHPGKTDVRIYDYVDRDVPMLMRMFERRLRAYRAIGYERGESSNHEFEPPREVTIEYDEEI
jgi:superfamily II DNA or RNA helicase